MSNTAGVLFEKETGFLSRAHGRCKSNFHTVVTMVVPYCTAQNETKELCNR